MKKDDIRGMKKGRCMFSGLSRKYECLTSARPLFLTNVLLGSRPFRLSIRGSDPVVH